MEDKYKVKKFNPYVLSGYFATITALGALQVFQGMQNLEWWMDTIIGAFCVYSIAIAIENWRKVIKQANEWAEDLNKTLREIDKGLPEQLRLPDDYKLPNRFYKKYKKEQSYICFSSILLNIGVIIWVNIL